MVYKEMARAVSVVLLFGCLFINQGVLAQLWAQNQVIDVAGEGSLDGIGSLPILDQKNLGQDGDGFAFASYYKDHMVLQQQPAAAAIWGYAPLTSLGKNVKVTLMDSGANHSMSFDAPVAKGPIPNTGVWKVQLKPMPGSISASYVINAYLDGQTPIKISDVLFGDVWVCSGQSNMVFRIWEMFNFTQEYALASKFPHIRLLTIADVESNFTLYDIQKYEMQWSLPSEETLKVFSAVCWVYARHVAAKLPRAMGLIVSAWGGTTVETWSSPESLHACNLKLDEMNWALKNENLSMLSDSIYVPSRHHVLYNAMIHPLLNMTIFGVLWYQGEANTVVNQDIYNCTFPGMIDDWRQKWYQATSGQTRPAFPFGFVQLGPNKLPNYTRGFPDIRWHQTADVGFTPNGRMENVFMATAVDMTDSNSPHSPVHYRDKGTVGQRLSLAGLAVAYGQSGILYQGPWPSTIMVDTKNFLIKIAYSSGKVPITVRNTEGFELCCKNTTVTCDMSGTEWDSAPLMSHDSTSVVLSAKACAGKFLLGMRYLWRTTPCPYKKCPVYSITNELPAPPFVKQGTMADFRSSSISVIDV